jgi:hypothetical protein
MLALFVNNPHPSAGKRAFIFIENELFGIILKTILSLLPLRAGDAFQN